MAYSIYGTPLRPGHCEVHPDVAQPYPCDEDLYDDRYEQRQPEPTTEELCAPHPYHGDDNDGGRCYCGQQRYPAGGPANAQEDASGVKE